MSRLLRHLLAWLRTPRRTTWLWCPSCRHDLNEIVALSFLTDDGYEVSYRCFRCGLTSRWLFDGPVPVLLKEPT